MKRTWRAGRVILAILLLSLIGVAFYVWPIGPRWTIAREQALGFNLKFGLLFTINYLDGKHDFELHGFDLASGKCSTCMPLGLTESNRSDHPYWRAILSTDCSRLACLNESDRSVVVFDVQQECRQMFSFKTGHISVDSIGLSSDGALLAFRGYSEVQIWDCNSGMLKKSLTMPQGSIVDFRSGDWICHPDRLQFSNDGTLLAITGDHSGIVVFDIESGGVIGQCPKDWMPVFLPDNRTLLTISDPTVLNEVKRYEVEGQKLKPISQSVDGETNQTRFLGVSKDQLFTGLNAEYGFWTVPSWTPEFIRPTIQSLFDKLKRPLIVKSWDIKTLKQLKEFQLAYLGGLITKVSPDGSVMTIEDNYELSLWDLPPRRSLTCWLLCSTLAVFALWLGWPQRSRTIPQGPPKSPSPAIILLLPC